MALGKTGIDYLTKTWDFHSGCEHWENSDICPIGEKCWAKGIYNRFEMSYEPTLHPEKLLDPLRHKKPERIGVCFTGDLGGSWIDPFMNIVAEISQPKCYNVRIDNKRVKFNFDRATLKDIIFQVCEECPQHQFFILTKNPNGLIKWGHWTDNCFVGTTVCNQKMFVENSIALQKIDAKNKWISFEPLMESMNGGECQGKRLGILKTLGVSFIVIGGWSRGKVQPKIEWISEIVETADKANIKVFLKDNLLNTIGSYFSDYSHENQFKTFYKNGIYRQELPEVK